MSSFPTNPDGDTMSLQAPHFDDTVYHNASDNVWDCAVVGAGLSGLTAAYELYQQGFKVCVIEASDDVGGVIQTLHRDGFQVEGGPNTFLSTATAINHLVQKLGLQTQVASPLAKHRYLYVNQQLMPLPHSPKSAWSTPLLSRKAKWRLLKEPFITKASTEETIADFTRRRLGDEVLDHLMTPFLTGIYAGDLEFLSLKAVFPKLWHWEQSAGSILAGLFQAGRQKRKDQNKKPKTPYQLLSFTQGMATLPKALAEALPAGTVRLNTRCEAIGLSQPLLNASSLERPLVALRLQQKNASPSGELAVEQTVQTSQLYARSLVLATPASTTANLLREVLPTPSQVISLETIPYAPMVVVHLGFSKADFPHPLDGFGHLIPRVASIQTLGAIWTSSLFADRCPEDQVLLTAFIGGALNPDVMDWFDETLVQQVLKDLQATFVGDSDKPFPKPTFVQVVRWPKAIPQYGLGHVERLSALRNYLSETCPMITFAGNFDGGVSVNDCVIQGTEAADQMAQYLQSQPTNIHTEAFNLAQGSQAMTLAISTGAPE